MKLSHIGIGVTGLFVYNYGAPGITRRYMDLIDLVTVVPAAGITAYLYSTGR